MKNEKTSYKERIDALKKDIIDGYKGTGAAEKIEDLLRLSGAKEVEPVHFCIDEKEVEDKYEGETFCIYKTSYYAHFMTKGGYHIFASPKYGSLYGTILNMLKWCKEGKPEEIEDESDFNAALSALTFVMECPMFAFGDEKATMTIANSIYEALNDLYERGMSSPQDDEPEKNIAFREAEESLEKLDEPLKEASERFDTMDEEA